MAVFRDKWGWVVILASSFVFGGTIAPMNAFGRLFVAMQNDLNITTVQSGWAGSVAFSSNMLASPIAVVVEGFIGYRLATIAGSTVSAVAVLVASFLSTYIGVVIVYGVIYGIFSNMAFHAPMCVLFLYFKNPTDRSRASGCALTGVAIATILTTFAYEKIVPVFGWAGTLRISSAFIFLYSVPASFLIYQRDVERISNQIKSKDNKKEDEIHQDHLNRDEMKASSLSGKEKELFDENRSGGVENDTPVRTTWIQVITNWRSWTVLLAMFLPAMAWSPFWMNCVSYFESINESADNILVYVTVTAMFDLVGRICFIVLRNGFALKDCYLVIALNTIMTPVALLFVLWPTKPILLICCACIGIGRGWFLIMAFPATTHLLSEHTTDHTVTVGMIAVGLGFSLGTLPAGAIFETSGSYLYAFMLNAVLFLLGTTLLVILQIHKRCKSRIIRKVLIHVNVLGGERNKQLVLATTTAQENMALGTWPVNFIT
ncbi:Monocarboxylate transporter 10 [Holothuria leucospilota]|uniref:Monocarboxylate transporter 10 n=1 Tax=Holothuria leucospilota TaxID=206669 RepID=A0A9Q0YRG5_HOLLE|nr:Monocarboxylate transporter 10 [Holothuria leucospilota]